MPELLLEIGCEEIPSRMIDTGAAELARRVSDVVRRERLGPDAAVTSFSTPRRLSVLVSGVDVAQPDAQEQVMGPSTKVAFKDGQPAPPALAFAKKVGLDLSQIQRVATPKGEYLSATVTKRGRSSAEIFAESLPKEINAVYWPKNMYWRRRGELFVRPVRWLVAMLDEQVIPLEFDGVAAGRTSRGHRVIGREEVEISRAANYVNALKEAKVLGREERLAQIRKLLDAATRRIAGARWREDAALLETVVNLTEFPWVVLGNFEREFLELPEEVLVTVMRDHQKYFAMEDEQGKLAPHFLAVLNTDGDPAGIIQHGNERVLRARFNDARFFWQTDQKHALRERAQWLKNVTFQKDLGNYYDKMQRVQHLCSWICEMVRAQGMAVRPGIVHKAAYLAKADLTTELVKEFTELQGIIGGLYSRVQELDPDLPIGARLAIADAIYDQYKPESMDDTVPKTLEGAVLAIGDKADSIAGMFALGLIPSGSKDPFALRRQANAVVKILAEWKLAVSLADLFHDAFCAYEGTPVYSKLQVSSTENVGKTLDTHLKGLRHVPIEDQDKTAEQLALFLVERLSFYLREVGGFRYDIVNAVLASDRDSVTSAMSRARAVSKVMELPQFEAISIAIKRVSNILLKGPAVDWSLNPRNPRGDFSPELLRESAESQLWNQLQTIKPTFESLRVEGKYEEALMVLSSLRDPIDTFFDEVRVLCDDPRLRRNRLNLLGELYITFSTVADFSEIVTEGKA